MRYVSNGIEIQYRECQILRDSARSLFKKGKGIDCDNLISIKEKWVENIINVAKEQEQKKKYCKALVKLLQNMELDNFKAVAEYTESLIKKGTGIDIMVPFISTNKIVVLPVNRHDNLNQE